MTLAIIVYINKHLTFGITTNFVILLVHSEHKTENNQQSSPISWRKREIVGFEHLPACVRE